MSPNTRSDTNSGPQNRTSIEDGGSSCRDRGREHRVLNFADTGQPDSGDSEIYSKDSLLRSGVFWLNLLLFTRIANYCWPGLSKQTLRIFTQQMYKFLSPDLIPTQSIGSCLIPSLGNQSQLSFQVKLQPGSG